MQTVCKHIGVEFDSNMLNITQESSSIEKDSQEIGFKKERASNWKKGGLNTTEKWICQQMCNTNLVSNRYEIESIRPESVLPAGTILYQFSVKISLALLMNLNA
ncbi:MAG: hypothetical protein IPP60_15360 [Sphingobacteriales bacterium]|nr:hypothetical protein [Sphingobacteriales bacterium]